MKMKQLVLALIFCTVLNTEPARADDQLNFDTPQEGVEKLCNAVRNKNKDCLRALFGPETDDILFSGDEVQDREAVARFREKFVEKHSLKPDGENRMVLVVGEEEWPFPIPLVSNGSGWRFDSEAGKEEIINRRIGRNELSAVETARTIADAQKDYFERKPNGKKEYAQKVLSARGKKDGLFWVAEGKQKPSPLGPLVARALADGYESREDGGSTPFHGYYFKFLPGKKDNFTLVAFPASYGNSGIMTFVTDKSGRVMESDLGEDTAQHASKLKSFSSGPDWSPVIDTE